MMSISKALLFCIGPVLIGAIVATLNWLLGLRPGDDMVTCAAVVAGYAVGYIDSAFKLEK